MNSNHIHPVFLLTGFASEYSLGVIANLLRKGKEQVIEVDFSVTGIPDLGDTDVVLITSQHPARTKWIFERSYGNTPPYNQYLSPMECMDKLNVRCSVYVPHDLEQPIISDEIGYLSFFDFYCSPFEFNPGISHFCQPLYTGWAKYATTPLNEFRHQSFARKNGVFFVNQLLQLISCGGITHLLSEYAAIIEHEVPFKLPRWPGIADMEKQLEDAGAMTIPADTPSTDVIANSAQIYSNAGGSVLAEASYLGIPAQIIPPYASTLPKSGPRLPHRRPFDFQLLISSIRNHMSERSRR